MEFCMKDELDITKNIRLTEYLKADIIGSTSELYKRMAQNADSRDVAEAIGDIILKAYLLSDTLGIGYVAVDSKLAELIKRAENEFGDNIDLSNLKRHLNISRGRE
ncbi:MAG: hypothetical protein IJT38_01390 [Clostridia bacterium]|nr:hypothetical protein [Clostridia bacterium]